jgi:hypothetical protein
MNALLTSIKLNWKTNLAALGAFMWSIPQVVSAITAYFHNQPADWKGAILGIIAALGLLASKDSDNHSTLAQVQASQATVENQPDAPALVKAANAQVAGK